VARLVAERSDALPALAEVFREYGYEGASLARLSQATGLGKGSLYHFFPGGKEEMAWAVLAEIDAWFEQQVLAPLREATGAAGGIAPMLDAVDDYFRSGRRVCLVGAFALSDTRDRFADAVQTYFSRWLAALTTALLREPRPGVSAAGAAEEIVLAIQGALVLARALDDPGVFTRTIARLRSSYDTHVRPSSGG
jgi:TetR/AcrR family transcriptional repressor of lmrAB and yxaGH operons